MAYIELPVTTSTTALQDQAVTAAQAKVPGYTLAPGSLITWLIEASAAMTYEEAVTVARVPVEIFRYIGEDIYGVPFRPAIAAQGSTTWLLDTDAGLTIPADAYVIVGGIAFRTIAETVLPGSLATDIGQVVIEAIEPGAAANGLSGAVDPVDTLDGVASIALVGVTAGGQDAQDEQEYLDDLRTRLRQQGEHLVTPENFTNAALLNPSIGRALSLNLYNADTDTGGVERCLTLAVADADGEELSQDIKDALGAYIELRREVNFLWFIIDPTYNEVDVSYEVTALPGFGAADVEANVNDALNSYLSPANWGRKFDDTWLDADTLRYLEVAAAINAAAGVDYIDSLEIALHEDELDTEDVPLTGPAALTRPGDYTATVNEAA